MVGPRLSFVASLLLFTTPACSDDGLAGSEAANTDAATPTGDTTPAPTGSDGEATQATSSTPTTSDDSDASEGSDDVGTGDDGETSDDSEGPPPEEVMPACAVKACVGDECDAFTPNAEIVE